MSFQGAMIIGDFFRWIRGLYSGGAPGVRCDFCSRKIPASSFAKGHAVVLAKLRYCRHCVDEVIRKAKKRGTGVGHWSTSRLDLDSTPSATR